MPKGDRGSRRGNQEGNGTGTPRHAGDTLRLVSHEPGLLGAKARVELRADPLHPGPGNVSDVVETQQPFADGLTDGQFPGAPPAHRESGEHSPVRGPGSRVRVQPRDRASPRPGPHHRPVRGPSFLVGPWLFAF